ncbi:MAG: histidine kinase [Holophagales bacterium]|nr:histidine kinase [Holophagales bacterium]
MSLPIVTVELRFEHDVVLVRQRARTIAGLLGFVHIDQTRIGTAVSEIARNAFQYAGGGRVDFLLDEKARPPLFLVRVIDRGPGIEDLPAILAGRFRSRTGMGMGIAGARRLVDSFDVQSRAGEGTAVVLAKAVPAGAPPVTLALIAKITGELGRRSPEDPFEEIQLQNQELLGAMNELRRRQEELEALNRELEDTNRGMVALFAELDENASRLKRANDLRAAFLSNMSHEFRTPLNAILAISRLLLDRSDGELTPEQERQAGFIRRAAEDLSSMVNDLLDLARIEAGRIEIRPAECRVENLLSSLRGMFRPMLVNPALDLVFEEPEGVPALWTDEGKVSQILRNLVSNALKFTERGEVRVSAKLSEEGRRVVFSVADTGIGIPPEHLGRIFEEYAQVDSPLQRKVTGTGLGLPLSRKLAGLLGGSLTVESLAGQGSTFQATIPLVYPGASGGGPAGELEGARTGGPEGNA